MAAHKVTIRELQRDISQLVKRAGSGETILICRYHSPVAMLGPIDKETHKRLLSEGLEGIAKD